MERFKDIQTYYVIFDKALGGVKWWHYFLNKDFRHIFLMRSLDSGNTLVINPMIHVISLKEYPNTITNMVSQESAQNATAILQYTVHYSSYYKPAPLELLTCVSVAKRVLGLQNRILTPKRLYHELIKAGAIVLKPFVPYL